MTRLEMVNLLISISSFYVFAAVLLCRDCGSVLWSRLAEVSLRGEPCLSLFMSCCFSFSWYSWLRGLLAKFEHQHTATKCLTSKHRISFELMDYVSRCTWGRAFELMDFFMKVAGRVSFEVSFSHSPNSRRERFQAVKCTKSRLFGVVGLWFPVFPTSATDLWIKPPELSKGWSLIQRDETFSKMPIGRKNLELGERSSRLMDERNSSEETLVNTDERQEARALHLTQGGLRCLTVEPTKRLRTRRGRQLRSRFFNP